MATEIAATSLFRGPDLGVTDNVVLRYDNGIITDILEGAGPAGGPRSFVIPAFVNAHDHARATASSSARSACRSKAGSCGPRSARRSIHI